MNLAQKTLKKFPPVLKIAQWNCHRLYSSEKGPAHSDVSSFTIFKTSSMAYADSAETWQCDSIIASLSSFLKRKSIISLSFTETRCSVGLNES